MGSNAFDVEEGAEGFAAPAVRDRSDAVTAAFGFLRPSGGPSLGGQTVDLTVMCWSSIISGIRKPM